MEFLNIVTILCTGLLSGVELAMSLFINPALWKLDDRALTRELAQSLGGVMPFWYGLCLLLLGAEAYLHWHQPGHFLLLSAVAVWAATILFTVTALVPINNRIAKNTVSGAVWSKQHKRWDTLHRFRIALVIGATICLLAGLHF